MKLSKTTNDNSVKCIPKHEQTREIKQNAMKNKSTSKKQNKIFSQNN